MGVEGPMGCPTGNNKHSHGHPSRHRNAPYECALQHSRTNEGRKLFAEAVLSSKLRIGGKTREQIFEMLGARGRDGVEESQLTFGEFVADGRIKDAELANAVFAVFAEFDLNDDGELVVPEYLRVWGGWARGKPSIAATK